MVSTIKLPQWRFQAFLDVSLFEKLIWKSCRPQDKTPIRGASPGIPYKLRNKDAIGGRGWNIATQERKICDVEIEIVTFVHCPFDCYAVMHFIFFSNKTLWLMVKMKVNWLFNVTINDISVKYMTAHRCAAGLKKLDLRSGSQCHRHFAGFFNVPVLHRHETTLFYGDSNTPPHLVASYDTLGIRRMYSRLKSPASSRGPRSRWLN